MDGNSKEQHFAEIYKKYKPMLFFIAYRMVGSVSEAEDIVQEVFLTFHDRNKDEPENVKAFLSKMTINRSIDYLRSARKKREIYTGPWLPEPLLTEPYRTLPEEHLVLHEDLSIAFLLLLERLKPVERAVFLLREVYGYEYEEIAGVIGKSAVNCRQIFSRAKKRIPNEPAALSEKGTGRMHMFVKHFIDALENDDPQLLVSILSEDVEALTDGGGKVRAAINPIIGRDRVVALYRGIWKKADPDIKIHVAEVNGGPGLVIEFADGRVNVMSFQIRNGKIRGVYVVANPDKLRHIRTT